MDARRGFGRDRRLKAGRDFARLKNQGRRMNSGCLVANWETLGAGAKSRLGVITSGKIGGAVTRNRARRLMREVFRLHQDSLSRPVDLVLVARHSIVGQSFAGVERDFLAWLSRAGLGQPDRAA